MRILKNGEYTPVKAGTYYINDYSKSLEFKLLNKDEEVVIEMSKEELLSLAAMLLNSGLDMMEEK